MKLVLTAIAVMLGLIALRPAVNPTIAVQAQGPQELQFATYAGNNYFFNSHTGDLWVYFPNGTLSDHLRMSKPGEPITKVR